jgi:hypothetical protein
VCLSSMFRCLFIEIRRGLEVLVIPEKSSVESSCLSKRLKLQSKYEKDSKFVQNCGLLLQSGFGIVNIRIMETLCLTYLLNVLLDFQRHQFHCNPIFEPKVMIKTLRYVQNPNLNPIRF